MRPVPLFVELCAGTAALSLRLQQRKAKPPVSRQGAKTGYADAILRVLGLRAGQKAEHYLLCEPDAGCRLLLEAYRDRALALAAAEIIRSWADEEPRALWERLRAEGPPVCPPADAREVARWGLLGAWSYRKGNPDSGFNSGAVAVRPATATEHGSNGRNAGDEARLWRGLPALPATITPDARTVDPREVARWVYVAGAAYVQGDPTTAYAGDPGANGGRMGDVRERGGRRLAMLPTLPATITPDARTVDPREVARWVVDCCWSIGNDAGRGGFKSSNATGQWFAPQTCAKFSGRVKVTPTLPATITPDARPIEPGTLPPGTVAYMDPPYLNTTGYAADLGRAEVVALARRWAEAGAVVCISEAEPIPELVADGWHAVEITGARVGQKRTFSKQQAEWLTLNRPPAWTVPVQTGLFG